MSDRAQLITDHHSLSRFHRELCRYVDVNLMQSSYAGCKRTIRIKILHFPFAVGSADHNPVAAGRFGTPATARRPKRPGQVAAFIIDLSFGPLLPIIETEFDL